MIALELTAGDLATLRARFAAKAMKSVTLESGVPLFWRGRVDAIGVVVHHWWVTAGGDVVITSDDTRIQP